MAKKLNFSQCSAVAVVYETKDYSMFSGMEYNRTVVESRVSKLMASLSEKEILNPIVVNEKGEIVDGQGRYEALKRLDRPIRFVISPGADINDCRRMNLYNTNWKLDDFVNSYVAQKRQPYMLFKRCKEETGFPYMRILRLCNHSASHVNKVIERGELQFTEEDIAVVKRVKEAAEEILDALQFTKRYNEAFIVAVKVMMETEGYDHQQMVRRCIKERARYNQMSNLESMLAEFSRIYNSNRMKQKLYFEDYMRNRGHNVRAYDESTFSQNLEDVKTLQPLKKRRKS